MKDEVWRRKKKPAIVIGKQIGKQNKIKKNMHKSIFFFYFCSGKDRNLNIVELLCANCNRWFHESCIGYQFGKLVPFITNYVFVCKNCSPSGLENFRRSQACSCFAYFYENIILCLLFFFILAIPQMCITAIANMRQNALKEGRPKSIFSKDKDIIPFIEQYWESMTTMPRRVTQSWYSTVQRSLLKDVQVTFTYEEHAENGSMFGLVAYDLTQIKPSYEAMGKMGALRLTEDGYAQGKKINVFSGSFREILNPTL